MMVAECRERVNGVCIWKYTRNDGMYLVREIGVTEKSKQNCVVASPSGKLYRFSDFEGDILDILCLISSGKAEGEDYTCLAESIYDESLLW